MPARDNMAINNEASEKKSTMKNSQITKLNEDVFTLEKEKSTLEHEVQQSIIL